MAAEQRPGADNELFVFLYISVITSKIKVECLYKSIIYSHTTGYLALWGTVLYRLTHGHHVTHTNIKFHQTLTINYSTNMALINDALAALESL